MKKFFLAIFLLAKFSPTNANGPDTVITISFERFMEQVRLHHPIAKQAEIAAKKGEAVLLNARGEFDPIVKTNYDTKQFQGKNYYGIFDAGLRIPTWFGIEAKAGFESNQGIYLNPEDMIPASGLWYAGISVPLGQGLFIDQRRADLANAKFYVNATQAERMSMLNTLLFEATKAYLEWAQAGAELTAIEEGIELATGRFEAVKTSAIHGDRAFIDTVEASIQVQNFRLQELK